MSHSKWKRARPFPNYPGQHGTSAAFQHRYDTGAIGVGHYTRSLQRKLQVVCRQSFLSHQLPIHLSVRLTRLRIER